MRRYPAWPRLVSTAVCGQRAGERAGVQRAGGTPGLLVIRTGGRCVCGGHSPALTRHLGQRLLYSSDCCRHSVWKQCPHARTLQSLSVSGSRQTVHWTGMLVQLAGGFRVIAAALPRRS